MVKRPKSPDILEDARFFTVYHPYPLHPDWHEERDQIAATKWVAECIGRDYLWAIHEKPRAGNMILLEVSKDFVDHGLLLGEHRWSEFLKNPTAEEKSRVTQVFHSFYARGRDAQKDGWKVIAVNSRWLYKWVPGKERIIHPYPDTHWCSTPMEDRTNKPLCRPLPSRSLPVEQLSPPPRTPAPVVGSSNWVAKQTEAPSSAKPIVPNAWTKPIVDTKKANQFVERDRSTPSSMPQSGGNAGQADFPPMSSPKPKLTPLNGKNAWGKPVPLQKFVTEAAKANAAKGKSGWGQVNQPASPAGAKSPLTEKPPKGPVNAWTQPLKIQPSHLSKPSPTTTPSTRSQSPWGAPEPSKDAWFIGTEDIYEKEDSKGNNTNAPGFGSNSNRSTCPPSPRKGRTEDRPREREPETSKHRSVSRAHAESEKAKDNEYDVPQRDKRSAWDVPSTEADKKVWDKGKKKEKKKDTANDRAAEAGVEVDDQGNRDTGETLDFEAADDKVADSYTDKGEGIKTESVESMDAERVIDWASEAVDSFEKKMQWGDEPLQTPDVRPMDVDAPVGHGERGPAATEAKSPRSPPRQPRSWAMTGHPESPHKGKRFDSGSPRVSGYNSRDASRSRGTSSPIKLKDLPPGRSDGQWDHSGFAELEPKKKFDKPRDKYERSREKFDKHRDKANKPRDNKYDKPRDKVDKPRDKYEKPKDRYDDRPRDRYDKPRDKDYKPKDRPDKPKGKFDKPKGKMPEMSSSKDHATFDWSTLEGQVEDWARSPPPPPPESDYKGKGKQKADDNMESLDHTDDWSSNRAEGSKDATMEVDEPNDWGEWGPPPPDTKKDKPASSRPTPKIVNMDIDTPVVDWGEWGPPPSPKKGSTSKDGMDVDGAELDWGEWGPPPPPAHLKKTLKSKVFRSEYDTPSSSKRGSKGKKFNSDRPKPPHMDSSWDSGKYSKDSASDSKSPGVPFGEWGLPSDSKKGGKQAETSEWSSKEDAPKAGSSNSAKVSPALQNDAFKSNITETAWGEWGPPPPSNSKKEPEAEVPDVAKIDDYTDWGHAPHKAKKLATRKTESKKCEWDDAGGAVMEDVALKDNDHVGKLEDWSLPSESVSHNKKGSTATDGAQDGDTDNWGAWSTSAPTEPEKSLEKKSDVFDSNTADFEGLMKPNSNDDIGFKAEDWGMAPVAEDSNNTPRDDFGTKAEDWGLPPDLGPDDDMGGSELHPWEKNTDMSAWGSVKPSVPFDPEAENLKCPVHNINCKPARCYLMARYVKEIEWRRSQGNEDMSPPKRIRGRGPRVRKKKEAPSIGRLRGFADIDSEKEEREEEVHGAEEAKGGEATATGGDADWQAPIGGNLEDWGVQESSMDAWS